MTDIPVTNRLRAFRLSKGWSQATLADRAGISRTAVTAIEGQRIVPSVAAALSLAKSLGCSVEELFGIDEHGSQTVWAWNPIGNHCRFWHAKVGNRTLYYPIEASGTGIIPADGVWSDGLPHLSGETDAQNTLVVACCDPAVSVLATLLRQSTGVRLIPFIRSSRQSLELLKAGLVHVAGLHLSTSLEPELNASAVQTSLGEGYRLVRIAEWQEGVAVSPAVRAKSLRAVLNSKLMWVGREPGSGARQCLDALSDGKIHPRRLAHDHRGVAEAIRSGWAEAGVCLRLASDEAGLDFFTVRDESFDLCFSARHENDPRIRALIQIVRSVEYRRTISELPGLDAVTAGKIRAV